MNAPDLARVVDSSGWGAPQSRLISWRDPTATRAAAASLPGLAYWRRVADGQLPPPPIGELFGMRVRDVEPGRIAFTCIPDGSMYNPLGTVHGGTVCTLLDTAVGCALHTTLPQGVGYTSVEIKVSYLKQVTSASGEDRRRHRRQGRVGHRVHRGHGDRQRRRPGRHRNQHAADFRTARLIVKPKGVLWQMRARGEGKLLFMSSVVGRIVLPPGAAYAATKWALEALVEALSVEAARSASRRRCSSPVP